MLIQAKDSSLKYKQAIPFGILAKLFPKPYPVVYIMSVHTQLAVAAQNDIMKEPWVYAGSRFLAGLVTMGYISQLMYVLNFVLL